MHPSCPDFDLCEACEAHPILVHPPNHPLLKMKSVDTLVPTVYRAGQELVSPPQSPPVPVPAPVLHRARSPEHSRGSRSRSYSPELTCIRNYRSRSRSFERGYNPRYYVAPRSPSIDFTDGYMRNPSRTDGRYISSVILPPSPFLYRTVTSRSESPAYTSPLEYTPYQSPPIPDLPPSTLTGYLPFAPGRNNSVDRHANHPQPSCPPLFPVGRGRSPILRSPVGLYREVRPFFSPSPSRSRSPPTWRRHTTDLQHLSASDVSFFPQERAASVDPGMELNSSSVLQALPSPVEWRRLPDPPGRELKVDMLAASAVSAPYPAVHVPQSPPESMVASSEFFPASEHTLSSPTGLRWPEFLHLIQEGASVQKLRESKTVATAFQGPSDFLSPPTNPAAVEESPLTGQEALLSRPESAESQEMVQANNVPVTSGPRSLAALLSGFHHATSHLDLSVSVSGISEKESSATVAAEEEESKADFITDVTVPDGQVFPPGAEFIKCWRMVNSGTRDWSESTELVFLAGEALAKDATISAIKVGVVEAGDEVELWTGEMKVRSLLFLFDKSPTYML